MRDWRLIITALIFTAGCHSVHYSASELDWPLPEEQKWFRTNMFDAENRKDDLPYLPPKQEVTAISHPGEARFSVEGFDEETGLPLFKPASGHDMLVWYVSYDKKISPENAQQIQIYTFPKTFLKRAKEGPVPASLVGWTVYKRMGEEEWTWLNRAEIREELDGLKPFRAVGKWGRDIYQRMRFGKPTSGPTD